MSALIAWRAGIPERWGYRDRLAAAAADARGRSRRRVHQAEYYQHLVASARLPEPARSSRDSTCPATLRAGAARDC